MVFLVRLPSLLLVWKTFHRLRCIIQSQGDISDGCKKSRKPGRNDNLLCMKLKISAKNFALALKFDLITRRTNKVHKDSCFHLLMGLEISKVAKKRHRIEFCIPLILAKVFMCLCV